MRSAILLLLFAVFGYAANAQLTLLPQAGFENPVTKINYNDLRSFRPVSSLQPQLSIRADYKFKKGFGAFVGAGTSRSSVSYSFSDPETGMNIYQASAGNIQLQLQAGLKYNTKPLFFNKQISNSRSSKMQNGGNNMKRSCGSHNEKSCCQKKPGCTKKAKTRNKGMFVSIQPLAGFAFMPSNKPDIVTKISGSQTSYTYNAGNVKTALLTGVGFEIGKKRTKYFTLSFNYFKGLGDVKTTLNTVSGTKATTTILNSKVSGWNTSIGFPISFVKRSFSKGKRNPECREQNRIRCSNRKVI